jgi:hypothetical protein
VSRIAVGQRVVHSDRPLALLICRSLVLLGHLRFDIFCCSLHLILVHARLVAFR